VSTRSCALLTIALRRLQRNDTDAFVPAAMTITEAQAELIANRGSQFDRRRSTRSSRTVRRLLAEAGRVNARAR